MPGHGGSGLRVTAALAQHTDDPEMIAHDANGLADRIAPLTGPTPAAKKALAKAGMRPFNMTLEEIKKLTDDQVALWTSAAKAMNIKPE